ncbi:MAG TPA: hypothetical protein DCL53_00240 [Thauera sp.]|nr:hypothetical protein [Thauera sp.]
MASLLCEPGRRVYKVRPPFRMVQQGAVCAAFAGALDMPTGSVDENSSAGVSSSLCAAFFRRECVAFLTRDHASGVPQGLC